MDYNRTLAFVDAANHGLRGTPFSFELASLEHVVDAQYANCGKESEFKKLYGKGADGTHLNVYLCNSYRRGFSAKAQVPPVNVDVKTRHKDGVVMMNPSLRAYILEHPLEGDMEQQQTFVHEIGHWLVRYRRLLRGFGASFVCVFADDVDATINCTVLDCPGLMS